MGTLPFMLHCLRCGHDWIRRTRTPPKQCPHCHSPYWNKEKTRFFGKDKKK